jgi:hypothetical protein
MNEPTGPKRLEVARQDLRRTRLVDDPHAPATRALVDDPHAPATRALVDGEARLRIEHFALTSNNITYAAFGEAMKYWAFFPTGDEAWGCIPVWGFAQVVESKVDGVQVGERCYGYWPMGRYLVVQPVRIDERGFVDGAAHRRELAAVYNQVLRCAADPLYRAELEAQHALVWPLFFTSFLIDDFMAEADFFGAEQVLLSSASSKTAYGTAFCLSQRGEGGPRRIGLTSPGNVDFCRSLGAYDEVLPYDSLALMDPARPTEFIDFAGNASLRRSVHEHFGDALRYSCSVGATHWQERGDGRGLPGPRPTLFFAPAQGAKRGAPPPLGWGAAELNRKVAASWHAFMQRANDPTSPWLRVRSDQGAAAVRQTLAALLAGTVDPRDGFMLSLEPRSCHGSAQPSS